MALRRSSDKGWLCRIDRVAGELNVLLALLAAGLAVLDVTVLVSQHIVDRLPQVVRVTYVDGASPAKLAQNQH